MLENIFLTIILFKMKKTFNKVPKLKTENGTLSGGFASLDAIQMNRVKGGKRRSDTNDTCHNIQQCGSDNSGCTNDSQCS
jgi:hypothetical protein